MESSQFNKLLQSVKESKQQPSITGELLTLNQYKELSQYANVEYRLVLKSRIYKAPKESSVHL